MKNLRMITGILATLIVGGHTISGKHVEVAPEPKSAQGKKGAKLEQKVVIKDQAKRKKITVAKGASIERSKVKLLELAKLYEQYSGKRVLLGDSGANHGPLSFKLEGPLTDSGVIQALDRLLAREGYAFIPVPKEKDLVVLREVVRVPFDQKKKPKDETK